MKYREELICDCPPASARDTDGLPIMYRIICGQRPTDADFHSLRRLNPNSRHEDPVLECRARGLSLFTDPSKAKQRTKKKLRDGKLCGLKLTKGAGKIIQSGRLGHYTWWPFADFDILSCCEVQTND